MITCAFQQSHLPERQSEFRALPMLHKQCRHRTKISVHIPTQISDPSCDILIHTDAIQTAYSRTQAFLPSVLLNFPRRISCSLRAVTLRHAGKMPTLFGDPETILSTRLEKSRSQRPRVCLHRISSPFIVCISLTEREFSISLLSATFH